ncbi:MAG: type II toxin-antitoxin system Phd/YefM family antitoxin [Chloroflexi bacterium]|nr:type II toxin-antitoxin system Phd/YefM family antitoxin [Chloroflexota bacterium]MCI0574884.1 type II toxin-antitoxin system Phd/YefM family antitoxin [Chloroflexota bacterium]MCI0648386.1 type II toxin-antitoxin system Phd/YefM family antitoxin [Chloroflexota bacterium]MCI0727507.1 type II toxin-antitoxin system Phd/YefM family antitoxin [Chloroflexota bacterium]
MGLIKKNSIGRVLRQVSLSGKPIIVEKAGKPVAVIVSIEAYEQMQRQAILPGDEDKLKSVFGMWSDRKDIDDNWLMEGRARWESL